MVGIVELKFIFIFFLYIRVRVRATYTVWYLDYWFKSFNRIFPTRQIQLFTLTYYYEIV